MPDVFDYTLRAGYMRGAVAVPISYSQQNTLGGGDIRRQDMPFVSNRMNFSKLDAMAHVHPAQARGPGLPGSAPARILTGRNVGESTTLGAGLMYTIHFSSTAGRRQ